MRLSLAPATFSTALRLSAPARRVAAVVALGAVGAGCAASRPDAGPAGAPAEITRVSAAPSSAPSAPAPRTATAPAPAAATPTASGASVAGADTTLVPADLAGTWRYTMETPAGGSSGYYVFRIDGGGTLAGEVRRALPGEPGGDAPARPVRDIVLDGARATFAYEAGSYGTLAVALRRTGPDAFAGRLFVGESALPLTVARVR